jgi:O-antigen/teichoic acid export membrane protein
MDSQGIPSSLKARLVAGCAVLLSGSTFATLCSFAYNVVIAHFLGPENYGQAVAVYTVLTLVSTLTLSFQLLSAKVTAQQETPGGKSAAYRELHRQASVCGAAVAFSLILFERQIAGYLHLSSPILILLIAIGAGFYVPLGARRGLTQGLYGFRRLAANLVLEAAMRLGGSTLMVLLGTGVTGVIAANAAASVIAWATIAPERSDAMPSPLHLRQVLPEMSQALVFFSGQMLINNSDMVLVKHFFVPMMAGLYAAVALIGRVIYTFSSAVINSMFPISAGAHQEDRKSFSLIAISLLLVFGCGTVMTAGLLLVPARVWTVFFGSGFQLPGHHGLSYLLALKGIACVIYSLSVVIITYEMSYRIANTSWIQLAFSGALIAGICRFHSSLEQVILVQLVLMIVLLLVAGAPILREAVRHAEEAEAGPAPSLPVIRRSSEAEAIAEFLKSDFEHIAYGNYRTSLRSMVLAPDLANPAENAQRRALLFLRHLALWKELPYGTIWYEIPVREADLSRIRVFPRAQWRRIGASNYSVPEVVARMRERIRKNPDDPFAAKVASMSRGVQQGKLPAAAVLMIGRNDAGPLTVIDGNHRLIAAALAGRLDRLRFLCGLSPSMSQCCWYQTNSTTLVRYVANLVRHFVYDPEAELTYCRLDSAPLPDEDVPIPAVQELATGDGATGTHDWATGLSSKLH